MFLSIKPHEKQILIKLYGKKSKPICCNVVVHRNRNVTKSQVHSKKRARNKNLAWEMLSQFVHAPVPELILEALSGEQLEEVRH